jgi:hypothetical protein
MEKEGKWESLIDDLTKRRIDPYTVVERMMAEELNPKSQIPNNK